MESAVRRDGAAAAVAGRNKRTKELKKAGNVGSTVAKGDDDCDYDDATPRVEGTAAFLPGPAAVGVHRHTSP